MSSHYLIPPNRIKGENVFVVFFPQGERSEIHSVILCEVVMAVLEATLSPWTSPGPLLVPGQSMRVTALTL